MNSLWMGTNWDEIVGWLPALWDGLQISIQVTLLTLLIGVPLGLVLALAVLSQSRAISWASLVFVETGRGTPALVLLQFIYFGLPQLELSLSSYTSALAALSLSTAAYTSEILRAGLQSVPAGQIEAAQALNMTRRDELRYVILPQGIRVAVPALFGFAILVFQSTSLCFAIALPEILSQANEIGSMTFKYFPVLTITGVIFAAICIPTSVFVGWLEHGAAKSSRR
jgi:polar amino acid transport system permease protein